MSLSSKFTLFDCSVKAHVDSLHFSFATWHQGFVSRGRWRAAAGGSSMCSLGSFSTAPLWLCRVLSNTPWPGLPAFPHTSKRWDTSLWTAFPSTLEGRFPASSTRTATQQLLPFSEPWKRQSVVLTGIDPYFGYEFAFPAYKASAIHGLAEGLILTATVSEPGTHSTAKGEQ